MKERNILIAVIWFVVYATVVIVAFYPGKKNEVGATPAPSYTVVIDAGHGGIDGGAEGVTTRVAESDINLAVAEDLKELLERGGFNVVMTRSTSGGLYGLPTPGFKKRDMKKRAEIINGVSPALVVSVHQNSCAQKSRRGSLVYYRAGDEKSQKFAKSVCAAVNSMPEKPRDCLPMVGDFYILNNSPCPAVITECGFLSNPDDEKLLCDEMYRDKFAYALYVGILDFLMN